MESLCFCIHLISPESTLFSKPDFSYLGILGKFAVLSSRQHPNARGSSALDGTNPSPPGAHPGDRAALRAPPPSSAPSFIARCPGRPLGPFLYYSYTGEEESHFTAVATDFKQGSPEEAELIFCSNLSSQLQLVLCSLKAKIKSRTNIPGFKKSSKVKTKITISFWAVRKNSFSLHLQRQKIPSSTEEKDTWL